MRREKTLTPEKYLAKFSRAVRWRLPPREAEDAISDYRELLFQEERDKNRLVEELGEPAQAAHLLADIRTYRRWLAVFTVLVFGLFLLAKWSLTAWASVRFQAWDYGMFGEGWRAIAVMAVGLPLSLIWFRRYGQKSGPVPKYLLLALAVVLAVGCWLMWRLWYASGLCASGLSPYVALEVARQAHEVNVGAMYIGLLSALTGVVGLVLARCSDRRWLALYILTLTLAAACTYTVFVMHAMDLEVHDVGSLQRYLFSVLAPLGAVGLIGTGVSLC